MPEMITIEVEELYFPRRWCRPWRRRYYGIAIPGEGYTQAMNRRSICYMACSYMACKYDKGISDYRVGELKWLL